MKAITADRVSLEDEEDDDSEEDEDEDEDETEIFELY